MSSIIILVSVTINITITTVNITVTLLLLLLLPLLLTGVCLRVAALRLLSGAHLRRNGYVPRLLDRRQLPPLGRYARHRCVRQLRLKELDARLQVRRLRLVQWLSRPTRHRQSTIIVRCRFLVVGVASTITASIVIIIAVTTTTTVVITAIIIHTVVVIVVISTVTIITIVRDPRCVHVARKRIPGLAAALV